LPFKTTYYWRVKGSDGTKESPYSKRAGVHDADAPAPPPPRRRRCSRWRAEGPGGRGPDNGPLPSYGEGVGARGSGSQSGCAAELVSGLGGSWQFMDQVVDTLRTYDTRWGYNGKRGNTHDPSKDVIAYHYGPGPDEGSPDVYIIDIIGGHCGSNPSPIWNDVTQITLSSGTIGKWTSRGRF
jgi:hypothetical protein